MKLCSFIILTAFKFGVIDPIHQIKVIAKISAYTVYVMGLGAQSQDSILGYFSVLLQIKLSSYLLKNSVFGR